MNLAALGALTCTTATIATMTQINATAFAVGKNYRKYFADWTIDCCHNIFLSFKLRFKLIILCAPSLFQGVTTLLTNKLIFILPTTKSKCPLLTYRYSRYFVSCNNIKRYTIWRIFIVKHPIKLVLAVTKC